MKNNAVMPYILIMVIGLTLVFFLSIKGLGDADKMAKEKEEGGKTEETASAELTVHIQMHRSRFIRFNFASDIFI